jgi:aminopeptidase N
MACRGRSASSTIRARMLRPVAVPLAALLLAALSVPFAPACRAHTFRGPSGIAFPRACSHEPRECPFDVLSYAIELELLPETRSIRAECTVRLRALERSLDEIELDLVGLEVDGVEDELGRPLAFGRTGGTLAIELAERLEPGGAAELAIRYSGQPERGLWYAGRRLDGSGPTLVFSHGETEYSRGWFPCFDEPSERASAELQLTMPARWTSVASGERVGDLEVSGALRVERWRMDFPHPSYLLGFVAGELTQEEGRAGDVPLQFVAEPYLADWIAPTFEETDEILAFLAEYAGTAYPYPKYSQSAVDNFPWGGMENISATTLTPLLLTDERGRRDQPPYYLIAHEAAHQWFGDLLTCADWSHLWLNEGFATYLTLLYVERTRGRDEFRAQVRETQEAYLLEDVGEGRRPTVWNVWKEPDDVFDTRPYQGAASRLHLLRSVLGDEGFEAGVREYVRSYAGRSVVTGDLERAMERATGRELERFFEQWFLRPGFPEFEVWWKWDESGELALEVEQVQAGGDGTPAVFELPAEIEVRDEREAHRFRLELDERRERFELPCPERPLYVLFDPDGWIPKRVHCEREAEEWLALSRLAEDVNARREAVLALGRLASAHGPDEDSPELVALLERVRSDGSSWVRADAATALALAPCAAVRDELTRVALGDGEPRVRAAALQALGAFGPDAGLANLAEEAFHAAPSYRVMAAAAGLVCSAAPQRAFEFLLQGLELATPHGVLAGYLAPLLAGLPDARVPAELRRLAADEWLDQGARAAAVDGLAVTTGERLENARFVASLLGEESFHLRGAAVRTLASFDDPGSLRALREYYPRARTAEERRTIEARLVRAQS